MFDRDAASSVWQGRWIKSLTGLLNSVSDGTAGLILLQRCPCQVASCASHLRWTMTVHRKGVCDVIAGCGILGMLGMLDWNIGGDAVFKD